MTSALSASVLWHKHNFSQDTAPSLNRLGKHWQEVRLVWTKTEVPDVSYESKKEDQTSLIKTRRVVLSTYWGQACCDCTGSDEGERTVQESCRCTEPCGLCWGSSGCSGASSSRWGEMVSTGLYRTGGLTVNTRLNFPKSRMNFMKIANKQICQSWEYIEVYQVQPPSKGIKPVHVIVGVPIPDGLTVEVLSLRYSTTRPG